MKSNLFIGLGIALLLIVGSESLTLPNTDLLSQTQPPCNPQKDKNCQ